MATDLGELLVPYMPTIRVPKTGDRVYRTECAFSYESPESEGGLYVCMNTFLGFGREHVERHYRKTGQCVYMHLKRSVRQKATGAAGGALPKRRNGELFLAPDIDESSVMQLAEMGFPLEACRKAVYYTGSMGAEVAFNWIIAHMEEPDFAEPLVIPGSAAVSSTATYGQNAMLDQPPEEIIALISSMGFQRNQAIQALRATNNNLERALDWIFSHPECAGEGGSASVSIDTENNPNGNIITDGEQEGPRIRDGNGRYELFGFISHVGTSTMSGHYVCHVKKEGRWVIYNDHKVSASERPPKDLGYIYFYHRISC
ncbi:hypothetical protein FKM82_004141 [Ascaphus truei]